MNNIDDITLLKLAEAEILNEAKKAAIRHATAGPSGWQSIPRANKSFLANTLLQTLSSNKIIAKKHESSKVKVMNEKKERKLLQVGETIPLQNNFLFKKPNKQEKVEKIKKKCKVKYKSNKKKISKHRKNV